MIDEAKAKYQEVMERKRAELQAAIDNRELADPITATFVAWGLSAAWASAATAAVVSIAVSAASYALSRAFAPKPQKQTIGKLQGSLQLMNSEQGIMIPEVYGAGSTVSLVTGSNPTYQNKTNCTSGAGGQLLKTSGAANFYDSGATYNVSITSGDAFFEVFPALGGAAIGFSSIANPTQGIHILCGIQYQQDGLLQAVVNGLPIDISHWSTGDKLRIEIRSGVFRLYKNNAEMTGFLPPAVTYPLYFAVVMARTNSGVNSAKVQIGSIGVAPNQGRGGVKIPAIIVWSSGIRKNVTTSTQPAQGGKGFGGHGTPTETISYDIDLGLLFGLGPNSLLRLYANADVLIDQFTQSLLPTGVYDPGVGSDPGYDPGAPPDPTLNYRTPIDRADAAISFDGDGVGTGAILSGNTTFAVYPGNATQQPDPTIESDVDAHYGAGSTPAFHNHSLIVLPRFPLSRWGGIVPNMTAVWEHQTLKTLDTIFASLCERVNVKTANSDYNFSGLSAIASRGMLIAGRLYAPAEVIGSVEIETAYSYFVTEAEGQIVGYAEGAEPTVTISDTEVGWLEGDAEIPDIVPEVETIMASEIALARQVDVKHIDPDKEWEPNTQSAMRQITEGVSTELLEVQLTLLADEARAVAQRKLYRDYVGGTAHKFTLPWTYLYLYPGYKIIINRAEGFTHTIRLTSLSGGIGVLECEGVAIEPEVWNQPATGGFPPGYIPPQQVPAMTVVQLLDTPLLRDGDATTNDGVGRYFAGVPRTGVNQNWQGFALYVFKRGAWQVLASSNLPATIGTVVSATGLSTDPTTIDHTGVIVVDLYGTTATLSSVAEADILNGANLAVAGEMVFNFATATQVAGYPNRWSLSVLLNGQKDTDEHITDTFTGKNFVLIDSAVKFAPMEFDDIDNSLNYRGVTVGQSLADAATVANVWTGRTLKDGKIRNLEISVDASGDWLIQFTFSDLRTQTGAVEVWPSALRVDPATIKRTLPVTIGTSHAVLVRYRTGFVIS
jgi:hypothetical protein